MLDYDILQHNLLNNRTTTHSRLQNATTKWQKWSPNVISVQIELKTNKITRENYKNCSQLANTSYIIIILY